MKRAARHSGFTLIELLVVIAVLALLVSILLPSLARARRLADKAVCASNLRQVAMGNLGYAAENQGYFVLAAEDMLDRGGNRKRWHGQRRSSTGSASDPEDNRFDPELSPLAAYIGSGGVKECPSFRPDLPDGFEAGGGGYGYNHSYIGGRYDQSQYSQSLRGEGDKACRHSARQSDVKHPTATVMFTDAAIAQDNPRGVVEYSFCETPYSAGVDGSADRRAASIHFRHDGKCNVAWVDGHVDSRSMTFSAPYGVYGISAGEARSMGFGWFGPDSNDLFDLD